MSGPNYKRPAPTYRGVPLRPDEFKESLYLKQSRRYVTTDNVGTPGYEKQKPLTFALVSDGSEYDKLDLVMPWGKFMGLGIRAIRDESYVRWLYEESVGDPRIVEAARCALNGEPFTAEVFVGSILTAAQKRARHGKPRSEQ